MVQAIGIIVTLFCIWKQLKLQSVTNMLSALSEFSKEWWSPEFKAARQEVCKSFREDKRPGSQAAEKICGFFETLGLHQQRKIVDTALLWDLYSYYVEHYWPMLMPVVMEMRQEDKTIFTAFEQFHDDMKMHSIKRDAPRDPKTTEVLKGFAKDELAKK
jgi:hypothetical protein